jgi:hypothetical protein
MITPQSTQLLVAALQSSAQMYGHNARMQEGRMQLRALELQLDHRVEMAHIEAGLTREFIHALINCRLDAIQSAFAAILPIYAERVTRYMDQQDTCTDAVRQATDSSARAECRARLTEIDTQLNAASEDLRLIYSEMHRMILLIGGAMPQVNVNDRRVLNLMQ